jgi:hypothetical protein
MKKRELREIDGWVTIWEDGDKHRLCIQPFPCFGEDIAGLQVNVKICSKCNKKRIETSRQGDWDFKYEYCYKHRKEIRDFWDKEEQRRHAEDIRDVSPEEFKDFHKNVLALPLPKSTIGTFIMGRYYLDSFNSRGCGEYMSCLMGEGDYLTYYCGSSFYAEIALEITPIYDTLVAAAETDEAADSFYKWRGVYKVEPKRISKIMWWLK